MKKLYTFIFLILGFITALSATPSPAEAANTSVYVEPYGTVYITVNHYGRNGRWDAQGTNNLLSNPTGVALAAISRGGSYVTNYACGNRDVVSASCAGGRICSGDGNLYNVTGGCGLSFVQECSNGCRNGACNPVPAGSPDQPIVQAATSDVCGGKIRLTWNAARATSYKVYRSTSQTGTYTEVANSPTTLTDFTDTPGGGTYYYKVKAFNDAGASLYSSIVSATASNYCPPLSGPSGLSAGPASQCGGKVLVSWNAVPGAAGYNVYRWNYDWTSYYNSYHSYYLTYSRGDRNFSGWFDYYFGSGLLTPNGTDSTSFIDHSPRTGDNYYTISAYRTAGLNKVEVGLMAQPAAKGTMSQPCPPPEAPQNLRALSACDGKAKLAWDASENANSYRIEFLKEGGTYKTAGNSVTTLFTDNPGKGIYSYRVIAVGTTGNSSPSASINVDTSSVCPTSAPIDITLKAVPPIVQKGRSCNLQWTVTNSESCKITGTNGDSHSFNPKNQTSFISSPLQSRSIYTLTCTNPDYSATKSATCSINPSQTEN